MAVLSEFQTYDPHTLRYFYAIVNTWRIPEFRKHFLAIRDLEQALASLTDGMDAVSVRTARSLVDFAMDYQCIYRRADDEHALIRTIPSRFRFITDEDLLLFLNEPENVLHVTEKYFSDVTGRISCCLNTQMSVLLNGLQFVPGWESLVEGKTILDIGAFIGDSTLPFVRRCQSRQVYCFEPDRDSFAALCGTIHEYALNAEAINLGVGERPGTFSFDRGEYAPGRGRISEEGNLSVSLTSVDAFVAERRLSDVALIKVDVEGFEKEVLEGATTTIASMKPILLMSVYHRADHFLYMKNWIREINPDYRFMLRRTCPQAVLDEIMLICY